ncbi:MAG TPA: RteC domain-containing protein [Puia sp.]|nr:RteC domain-containing protein [Puia sp.]
MIVFTKKLHDQLLINLERLDKNFSPENLEDPRLELIIQTIEKIKEKLKSHRFGAESEEIHFFKSVIPEILSLYIYYSHIMEWDRIVRQGSDKSRYDFYDSVFTKAENFRNEQKEFYEYCRDGKTGLDHIYFLRNSPMNRERVYQLRSITDPSSPTIHCEMLAKFLAFSRLEYALHLSIMNNKGDATGPAHPDNTLTWSFPKIKLIEIIYAFHLAGTFNEGKADLKTIVHCFEKVFHISLGNYSRSFQEILGRKMGYTPFIDELKEGLLKKIDSIEKRHVN